MKLSLCTFHLEKRFGYQKAFRMIRDAGFDALDYNLDDWCGKEEDLAACRAYYMTEEELRAYYTEMYEYASSLGLTVGQTHSVFGAPGFFNHREMFLKITRNNILQTHLLHCKYTVIHPIATPDRIGDEGYEECHKLNLEFFRSLIPDLEKYDVKLGIEPMWYRKDGSIRPTVCSRPEEILTFIDELNSDRFCSCPDLGHFQLTGEETGDTPGGALRKLGSVVKLIHAHEVIKDQDSHTAPYIHGTMDWEDIVSALREIDYDGTFSFEVGGNYFGKFPDALVPEALRHLAAIGNHLLASEKI